MTPFTDRQREIIETAVSIIAQKGIQQLTIKNISMSMGVSEPALYRHFHSKMDILLAILTNFKEGANKTLLLIESSEKSSVEKIEAILRTHFIKFATNSALAATIFSEEIFQNDKKLADKVASIMEQSQNGIERLIQSGQENKEIRDDIEAKYLATLILGSLRLLVTQWRLSRFSFDLEIEGAAMWESIEKLIKHQNPSALN